MPASLYEAIGEQRIEVIVRHFYEKCLVDPMLAHFFMHIDHQHLVQMQVQFLSNLLGGPRVYQGLSLQEAHRPFVIRPPHFRRRQRLLQETMAEQGLEPALAEAWLALEERLRPLITNDPAACSS